MEFSNYETQLQLFGEKKQCQFLQYMEKDFSKICVSLCFYPDNKCFRMDCLDKLAGKAGDRAEGASSLTRKDGNWSKKDKTDKDRQRQIKTDKKVLFFSPFQKISLRRAGSVKDMTRRMLSIPFFFLLLNLKVLPFANSLRRSIF